MKSTTNANGYPPTRPGRFGLLGELLALTSTFALVLLFYAPRFCPDSALVLGDSLEQNVQHRVYATNAIKAGRLPHWCDAVFGGYPFLSDPQTAVFFPPYLALSLAGVDAGRSNVFDAIAIGFVVAAALGTYLLARALDIGRIGSVAAAIFMAHNGYMVNHLSHTVITSAIACNILGMWALVLALKREDRRWAACAAMWFCSAILAGHWQTAMFGFYAAAAGGLFLALTSAISHRSVPRLRRSITLMVVAFALAVVGALIQVLPTVELLRNSTRAKVTLDFATAYSLPAKQLPGLLLPSLYQPLLWRIPPENRWELFWNHWGIDGSWEFQFWWGIAGFALVLFGWLVRANRLSAWFLAAVVGFTVAASMGQDLSLYKWLYRHLPGWQQIRIPPRLMWVGFLAGALLIGMGLDTVATRPRWPARRIAAPITAALLGAVLLAGAYVLLWALQLTESWAAALEMLFVINPVYRIGVHRSEADFLRDMAEQFAVAGTALGVVFLWLWGAGRRRRPAPFLAMGAVALLFAELAIYGVYKNVGKGDHGYTTAVTPMHACLAERPSGRLHSFYPGPWEKNTGESSGIPLTGGYNPLQIAWVNPFVPPEESSRGRRSRENGLDAWNVTHVAVPSGGVELPCGSATVHLSTGALNVLLSRNHSDLLDEIVFDCDTAKRPKRVHLVSGAMGCLGLENGTTVGLVEILGPHGEVEASAPLRLGFETAEWTYDQYTTEPLPRHGRPQSAFTDFNEGHTTGAITYFVASFDIVSTAARSVRVCSFLDAPRWLAVTHLVVEYADAPAQKMIALEGLGYRPAPSREAHRWLYWRRPDPPGWAWLVPTAIPVSYKNNFQWIIQRYRDADWNPRKLVLVDKHQLARMGSAADFNAPDAHAFDGLAQVEHPAPELWRIRTVANQRGWLVLSQTWYRGWSVKLDGVALAPGLLRANGSHTALPVPEGTHVIELEYSTPWFKPGAALSAVGWVLMILGLVVPSRKSRKENLKNS